MKMEKQSYGGYDDYEDDNYEGEEDEDVGDEDYDDFAKELNQYRKAKEGGGGRGGRGGSIAVWSGSVKIIFSKGRPQGKLCRTRVSRDVTHLLTLSSGGKGRMKNLRGRGGMRGGRRGRGGGRGRGGRGGGGKMGGDNDDGDGYGDDMEVSFQTERVESSVNYLINSYIKF